MNKALKKQVDKYCKEISAFVICPAKQKRSYIKELRSNINELYTENPSIDIEEITGIFGTPEQIAESFKSEADAINLRKQFSVKKMIFIFLLAALVIYLIFIAVSLFDVHTEAHGYFSEGFMLIKSLWGGEVL